MYKLIWKEDDLLQEKKLNEDLANQIIQNHILLNKNIRCLDFYYIVKTNFTILLNKLNFEQTTVKKVDAIEINRLLYNFLNSLYSYIEYLERNFKQEFSKVKINIYDKNFSYRLLYNLRRYMTHCDFGVTIIKSTYNPNNITKEFLMDLNKIITSNMINKTFQKELMLKFQLGSHLDILPILKEFENVLIYFQEQVILVLSNHTKDSMVNLLSYIPLKRVDVWLYENKSFRKSLFNIVTKYYFKLAHEFIYKENLFKNKDHQEINNLFMYISEIYYGEKGCVCK